MSNPRKPKKLRRVSAGISIAANLKTDIRTVAEEQGLCLSAYASRVFTDIVTEWKAAKAAAKSARK